MAEDQLRHLLDELHRADDQRMSIPRTSPYYAQAADRVDELTQAIWQIVRSEEAALPDTAPDVRATPAAQARQDEVASRSISASPANDRLD